MLPPPTVTGYHYIRPLGSGGFADVYLFDQNMPRRRVAMKVLRTTDLNVTATAAFRAEANVMARVSSHPSILTIFEASISSDGRPYIATEYCVSSYAIRYKTEPIGVPEILAVGVKIGSALETLHQAGLLHRDVKPSNILTTEFGLPVLADFGIAASLASAGSGVVGMSVPWAAPEVIRESTAGTVLSEVYSFAATLYTLVEGHSPVQIVGGDNSRQAMAARVQSGIYRPLRRADIPAAAREVINRALSPDPGQRPSTIAQIIGELQRAQQSIGLPATNAEYAQGVVRDPLAEPPADETSHVVRSSVSYETRRQPRPGPRFAAPATPPPDPVPTPRRSRALIAILAGVCVLAAGVIAAVAIIVAGR